jgi:DNA replication protein DnaC
MMDEQLKTMLKYLRLGGLAARWDEFLAEARQECYSHERLLKNVLQAEYSAKKERARLLRRRRANIPEILEIETFPFDRQPNLDRQRVMALYDSFEYMTKQRDLVWLGPTGVGKSGLATGFLLQALDREYRGHYVTFPELLAELYASLADHSQQRVLRKYARFDCLLIDEIGYVEIEAAQDQDHDHHVESGLRRLAQTAEERPLDRRPLGPADGDLPHDQHEGLPQLT